MLIPHNIPFIHYPTNINYISQASQHIVEYNYMAD